MGKIRDFLSKHRPHFTIKNGVIAVFVVLFLMQSYNIQKIFGTFSFLEGRDVSLITEVGQIREAYFGFGDELNEIRDHIRVDKKVYSFDDATGEIEVGQNEDELQLAIFRYASFMSGEQKKTDMLITHVSYLESIANSDALLETVREMSLKSSDVEQDDLGYQLSVFTETEQVIASLFVSKETGMMYLQTIYEDEDIDADDYEEFEEDFIEFIEDETEDILEDYEDLDVAKADLADAMASEEVKVEAIKLGLLINLEPVERDVEIAYIITNKDSENIGEVRLNTEDLDMTFVDLKDDSIKVKANDLSTALIPFLQKLDTRTFIEIKYEDSLQTVQETLMDKGFKLLLKDAGLSVAEDPREDDDRIYYDLLDPDGVVLSSLVIEKTTGVINIVQPDGTKSENILLFDPEVKKKTVEIPEFIPEFTGDVDSANTFNILIAGKHGGNVDTMIFAHMDETERTIQMISIPRDLFYNGRKINALPSLYGMSELKRVLSDITGYKLDKFILIDMYAFIDVVDLVGGIDITLDSAVIDPTYKVVDEGVEGTLHYEPGDYHLGGVEALRLARTRHTSSDFARAERQQMILESLKDKANNFGLGDADTIYKIAKTVLGKTETDISLDEGIAYYFRYQDYTITSNNVMSSGNVLYVPPYVSMTNCQNQMAVAEAEGLEDPGCSGKNHAYTLLPRNGNWDVIKWFFREKFSA